MSSAVLASMAAIAAGFGADPRPILRTRSPRRLTAAQRKAHRQAKRARKTRRKAVAAARRRNRGRR